MTPEAGERYAGLTPAEAAERVMADLRAQGLVRGEEPYTHTVPFSHRSGARVEPLVSLQWFCDMSRLAAPAIAAVEEGRVRFTPAKWGEVYLDWMREIRPWCISRQLWWGHQIPVWYRGEETYVGREAPGGDGWERDPDVLDTWFSSALWPFATLGWPERTPELERFYPTQVLSTARDIIFLWVARMVMMGCEFMGEEPFADVAIHSVVQAPDGRRMSKSLGTGIDPMDEIERHGADALRFGLLMMSSTQDVRFSQERIDQGRQLVTKLWNAVRLVVDRGGRAGAGPVEPAALADRWIASRVADAVERGAGHLARFELSQLADLVYHVVFDDYCDWYLELLKAGEATPEMAGAALEQLLALAHPLMPFVTEEGWSRMPGSESLMAVHPAPSAPGPRDEAAEAEIRAVQEEVNAIRGWRAQRGISPATTSSPRTRTRSRAPWRGPSPPGIRPISCPGFSCPTRSMGVGVAGETVDARAEIERLKGELRTAEAELERAEREAVRSAVRRARPGPPGQRGAREGGALRGRAGDARGPHRRARVTPEAARDWIAGLQILGMRLGLERIRALLGALGHPERAAPALHVVGTNGKSSTARLAAAAMAGPGRRVGAYLSPHIVNWTERVQIDGAPIGDGAFAEAATAVRAAAEGPSLPPGDPVTQFEALTAIALWSFREAGAGAMAIEAGLGGPLGRDQRAVAGRGRHPHQRRARAHGVPRRHRGRDRRREAGGLPRRLRPAGRRAAEPGRAPAVDAELARRRIRALRYGEGLTARDEGPTVAVRTPWPATRACPSACAGGSSATTSRSPSRGPSWWPAGRSPSSRCAARSPGSACPGAWRSSPARPRSSSTAPTTRRAWRRSWPSSTAPAPAAARSSPWSRRWSTRTPRA